MNEGLKEALGAVAKLTKADSEKLLEAHEKSMTAEKEFREKAQGDIMAAGNTGFGPEVRQDAIYQDEMYSMINRSSQLLSFLPGNHGQITTSDSVKVAIFGELDYFNRGTELSGNPTFLGLTANDTPKTDKANIIFQKLQKNISISIEELTRYSGGEAAMYRRIENLIVMSFAKTVESFIINGDSDATSGNINNIATGNLAGYHAYGVDGLRKVGITNGVIGSGAAYSRSVLGSMFDAIDYYNDDADKMLWIFGNKFASKVRFDPNYSTQEKFGQSASNTQGGYVKKVEGIDAYQTKDVPRLVNSAGKVASTGLDHVAGLLIYRPAIQYAYGLNLNIVTHTRSDGILFDCTGYFGFDIVNGKAGLGKTVAYGLSLA